MMTDLKIKMYTVVNFLINYFSLLMILAISQTAIQFPLEKKITSVQSRDIKQLISSNDDDSRTKQLSVMSWR